jgi:hypothetical protein
MTRHPLSDSPQQPNAGVCASIVSLSIVISATYGVLHVADGRLMISVITGEVKACNIFFNLHVLREINKIQFFVGEIQILFMFELLSLII